MISTMIWTMVAAKAKQGINAANTPESGNIKTAAKKGIFMIVMIALACGMKLCGDNEMLNNYFNEEMSGISLRQKSSTKLQSNDDAYWNMDDPYYVDEDVPTWGEDDEEDFEPTFDDEEDFEPIWEEEEDYKPRRHHKRRHYDDDYDEDYEEDYRPRRHHKRHHHEEEEYDEDYDMDYEEEPRRHHKRGHGKRGHGKRGHGKQHLRSGKSMYQQLQEKLTNDPQAFEREVKVAGAFTGVFLVAVVVSFMSLLSTYKKSVAKHEFLLAIYKNPNAKVVPTHKAKEFIEHKKLEVKHKRAVKAQKKIHEEYTEKMAQLAKI